MTVGAPAKPDRRRAPRSLVDRQQRRGGVRAQDRGHARRPFLGRQVERHAAVALEAERDAGGGERQPADGALGGIGLGAGGFQELAAGRRGVEQIGDHDAGAWRAGAGATAPTTAAFARRACGVRAPGGREVMARRAAAPMLGQRLAAEAQGGDADEVVVGELRGGVPLHGKRQFLGAHAASVVGHLDAVDAAAGDG